MAGFSGEPTGAPRILNPISSPIHLELWHRLGLTQSADLQEKDLGEWISHTGCSLSSG